MKNIEAGNMVYFIGCLHFSHSWMAKHRGFQDEFYHDEHIIEQWNKTIKKKDLVWILGDITMESIKPYPLLDRLSGRKKVVLGNHDLPEHTRELLKYVETVAGVVDYKGYVLSHIPIHPSEISFCRGNIHCVDIETEILTKNGWKKYNEISIGDSIYSLGKNGEFEDDVIKSIIFNPNYTGNIVEVKDRSTHLIYTDEHVILSKTTLTSPLTKIRAKDLINKKNLVLPCSAVYNQAGIPLSDDLLRLYICLAADGNITEYRSCRLGVNKERKHVYFRGILDRLGINYSFGSNKTFKYTLGFQLPEELYGINIKGLDKILLKCNREQAKIVLEAYKNTDGCKNGNGIFIYTSKPSESEILSHLFTINGFKIRIKLRKGGFKNSGINYAISVMDKQFVTKTQLNKITTIKQGNLPVWCIITNNSNFISRRKGEIIITGNCHIHENKIAECIVPDRYGDTKTYSPTLAKYFNVDAQRLNYKPMSMDEITAALQQENWEKPKRNNVTFEL